MNSSSSAVVGRGCETGGIVVAFGQLFVDGGGDEGEQRVEKHGIALLS